MTDRLATSTHPVDRMFLRLFEKIEHGDAEHRAWLRKELSDFAETEAADIRRVIDEKSGGRHG